jgi:hypothetical protein
MKLVPIELSTYLKKYGEDASAGLWVINRTNPRGNLGFSCIGELNRPTSVFVPCTFIPIDLTTMLPRQRLLESSSFRRQLARNSIAIVDNEEVAKLFAVSTLAQNEHARINKIFGNSEATTFKADVYDVEKEAGASRQLSGAGSEFTSEVISRSNEGEDADSLIDLIMNRADQLNRADVLNIINAVTDSRLKEKCAEIMNELLEA